MKNRTKILESLGVKITKNDIEEYSDKKQRVLEKGNPYEVNEWVKNTYGISANEMIDAIIKTGDILQIYEFLYLIVDAKKEFTFYKSLNDLGISDEKLKQLEDVILKSKNAKLIRYCIGFVPGIDLDKYLKALYDTKSFWDILALSVLKDYIDENEVANPELLSKVDKTDYENALKEANKYDESGEYFPYSLEEYKEFKGENNSLKDRIIESKNPYLICELANYIEYLRTITTEDRKTIIEELAKAELATGDAMGIYEFLSSVQAIPKDLFYNMVQRIIEIDDEKYIRYTLEFTPYKERVQADNERDILGNAFIRINNREGAKRFIKEKEGDAR